MTPGFPRRPARARRSLATGAVLPLAILLAATLAAGCGSSPGAERKPLVLASTTSVEDCGLLNELVKQFEEEYPYTVKAVAVGSGAALFMGRNGDADVMLTHEPKAEADFMAAGYGERTAKVMHNDFVIVGPPSDPAGIKGLQDADEAFRRIVSSRSRFVSRADASGTNAMEMSVWDRIGARPDTSGYIETGQGMGQTLRIADEKDAYTIADRATFIVLEDSLASKILVQGDPRLVNQYSVTPVNPANHPGVNNTGAKAFEEFLLEPSTREYIERYGRDRYHRQLFYPG